MANGMPVGPYRKVLAASDLSACSVEAVTALVRLQLAAEAPVILFRAVDVPEVALMMRASTTVEEIRHHVATREAAADDELRAFAATLALKPANSVARIAEGSTAATILKEAETAGADLVVIGTRGQTGLARFLLGSVAEAVLRSSPVDVLVVPPPEPAA
jgi:nucleotide-binding universal stress UspA family protein